MRVNHLKFSTQKKEDIDILEAKIRRIFNPETGDEKKIRRIDSKHNE